MKWHVKHEKIAFLRDVEKFICYFENYKQLIWITRFVERVKRTEFEIT